MKNKLSQIKKYVFGYLAFCLMSICSGESLRSEINLASDDWQSAIADTIDVTSLPSNFSWSKATVPTKNGSYSKILKSADNMWQYCNVSPDKLVDEAGQFNVTENRSAWFKREVNIPDSMLKNRIVHLVLGGAAYRSGYFINGKFAAESIQSTLPLDFDITKFVKPGKNQIVIVATTREGLIDPKARVYIAPSMGTTFGIRGPVRLEFRPKVAVEDVFVKTSVKNKNIEFQTTISNNSNYKAEIIPKIKVRSARDPKQVVGEFQGAPISVFPGKGVVFSIKENWVAPILWSLITPEMYIADVSLFQNGKEIDSYQQTFGFREFSIDGKDFLLNGKRVVLLRNSGLNSLKTLEYAPESEVITHNPPDINSIRTHLGTYNRDIIYRANELGIMIVPESSWSWVNIYQNNPEKVEAWLPGTLEYFKEWAKHLRNEPSVVIYSLANETYWQRTQPDEMAVAKQIVDVVRKTDPTRPLQSDGDNYWGGLLDIINIHYPEGESGTLRLKYPNSSIMLPNDIEWITDQVDAGQAWRAKFVWDRPLVIGEFGGGGAVEGMASFGGDDVYNWEKWSKYATDGRGKGNADKEYAYPGMDLMRKMCNYYRRVGVAGLNPWGGDLEDMLKDQTVNPIDYHPNVESGGTFKREISVLNDGRKALRRITCYLTVNGINVAEKNVDFYANPGKNWEGTVELPVPAVTEATQAEFTVRLFWMRGSKYIEEDRYSENIYLIPKYDLSALATQIAIIDVNNSLEKDLKKLGLAKVRKLQGKIVPRGIKMLIIGVDGFDAGMAEMLDTFVEGGGVVLMLPQKGWKPYRVELPERDSKHAATQAWIRRPSHPIFKNMNEEQFSYWNEDNVISYETFKKPKQGAFKVLLDCGGRYGLSWSPLLEIPVDQGAFIMTTLELTDDPVTEQLLANVLEYGCSRKAEKTTHINVLAGENAELKDALVLIGADVNLGIGQRGPVLVDGTADFDVDSLKQVLNQGRVLWLHGFTAETLSKLSSLLPEGTQLRSLGDDEVETVSLCNDEISEGIANYDLLWHIPASWQGAKNLISKISDWQVDGQNLFDGAVKPLTSPAMLCKINSGNGTILLDNINWEKGIGKVTDKALRIPSTLLQNLNCDFVVASKINYKYDFVNLSRFANMGYMDSIENDGVGGWTDQGINDMRFFLINHSGRMNGDENAPEVPVPPFPTDVEFEDVPYKLVDPKSNGGKAVLSLGSSTHASRLMRKAGPVQVNTKADKLWFLHSMAWADQPGTVIAEYTVVYDDGSRVKVPVRSMVDVGDWHNPSKYVNAEVAWNGRNMIAESVGLHSMSWKNSFPEKTIKTISLRAGLAKAQYVLVAITCGVEESQEDAIIYELDFENPKTDVSQLNLTESLPVRTEDGMVFSHGSAVTMNAEKVGLKDLTKTPFSVSFDITATDKPDGYCAGLVETGPFRITLKASSMKVVVETYDNDGKRIGIESKNSVELNQRVQFEYKSDGKKGILFRDGKIDSIAETPLLQRDVQVVRLGKAGGKDYNFNGKIHSVTFKEL